MEVCDYCGSSDVVGHQIRRHGVTWGRLTIGIQWLRRRVCRTCLDETDSPLSAAQYDALRAQHGEDRDE